MLRIGPFKGMISLAPMWLALALVGASAWASSGQYAPDPATSDFFESAARLNAEAVSQIQLPGRKPALARSPKQRRYSVMDLARDWPPMPVDREEPSLEVDDTLRDALAPSPGYALWQGSKPMPLPKGPKMRAGGSRVIPEAPAVSIPEKRPGEQAVTLEFEFSGGRKALFGIVKRITASAGFRLDERFDPVFIGLDRKRVVLRGWIPVDSIADALSIPGVKRIETDVSDKKRGSIFHGAMTELLIGIRIPPEISPDRALRETVERISRLADFEMDRPVAYQRIPGTSQLAIVVTGRVPVRKIGELMSDPGVIRVAPSPKLRPAPPAAAVAPWPQRVERFVVEDHPAALLVVVLVGMFLLGPSVRRRPWRQARFSPRRTY